MKGINSQQEIITFSPSLQTEDPLANYWLRQVTMRLRREICWRWHLQEGITAASHSSLPPLTNKLTEALDMSRYWEEKCQFYQNDPTAKYLTEKLATEAKKNYSLVQGSFSWVVHNLKLDNVSSFILALGLIVSFDHAASEVIAACLNDSNATHPTLALAQKLWEKPEEILAFADPEHPLWRYGLLQSMQPNLLNVDWQSPLVVHPLIAKHLLFSHSSLPQVLVPLEDPSPTPPLRGEGLSSPSSPGGERLLSPSSPGGEGLSSPSSPGGERLSSPSSPGGEGLSSPSSPGGEGLSSPSSPGGERLSSPSSPGGEGLSSPSSPGGEGLSSPSSPGGERLSSPSSPGGERLSSPSSPGGERLSCPPFPRREGGWGVRSRTHLIGLRLRNCADKLRIVPIQGLRGSFPTEVIREISNITQRNVVQLKGNPSLFENGNYLKSLVTLCWLTGWDLFIPRNNSETKECEHNRYLLALQSMPITIFLEIRDRKDLTHIPSDLLLPIVEIPTLDYSDRIQFWQEALGTKDPNIKKSIADCSRRFRYEKGTIQNICMGLQVQDSQIIETDLIAACRAELDIDIGELAQPVTPRFEPEELVLPPKQQALFEDIYQAMKSLTEVHYEWGTAKTWNECGISVLFAGLPGTGKTMAAEILAAKLDLPMYRIDLSQVVNKYIGETEKNLRRLFDAADISDMLLFFDEADALFGRRTEVKDAHDRYANLEISYLLERMERFKGLAILATNRKKDLDEAFLRRLRYIVDFPLPDIRERYKIWKQAIPKKVDVSALDFEFLAKQFPLAGGNIRSIVFNACLQTAGKFKITQLTMEQIIVCIKREYDKLNRPVSLEQFGSYAKLVERMNNG